ncbi:MAG TPA: tRNA lysidine(34) synthetase TilS, partial [Thermoanaerobaculia bacterium]
LLAVSGGADSMAFLYAAAAAAPSHGWKLSIGHVHHGLRGRDAERDLVFVESHARRLDLPFFARRASAAQAARALKLSPEAAARHVRYAALSEIAREAKASRIATVHQRDDRIESYLIARRRRAGVSRRAGPRSSRADGVVRPLLSVSRAEIRTFLEERGIAHRRDSSNGNLRLERNRVRRDLARRRTARGAAGENAVVQRLDRLDRERERLEQAFALEIQPSLSLGPGSSAADADLLAKAAPELARLAIEAVARPFAAPGHPPVTGREREEIRRRLREGGDFRFEAGRRIQFERRGSLLTVRPRRAFRAESV